MLLRGLVLLIPAFMLMPKFIGTQGMWLAVPTAELLTLTMKVHASKGKG